MEPERAQDEPATRDLGSHAHLGVALHTSDPKVGLAPSLGPTVRADERRLRSGASLAGCVAERRGREGKKPVRRELFEETGLLDPEVGPCVWQRDHTFRWGTGMLRQVESYFVVHTAVFEISTENHEEAEREFLDTHRWFTLEELRSHDETLVPGNFAELLAPLLRGEYPANPVTVGI